MAPKKKSSGTSPCGFGIDYDATFVNSLEDNAQALAGCLNLETTRDLWNIYIENAPMREILDDWMEHRKKDFKQIDAQKKSIKPIVMDIAYDKNFRTAIWGKKKPQIGSGNVTVETLASVSCCWFGIRLMKCEPTLFPKSETQDGKKDIDRYDLCHAWKFLVWLQRAMQRKKGKPPANPPANKATTPIFHRDPTSDGAVPTPTTTVAGNELAGIQRTETAALDGRISEALDEARQAGMKRPPMGTSDLEAVLKYLMNLDEFTTKCVLSEPSNTDVPDENDNDGSLAQLIAAGEARVTSTAYEDSNDVAADAEEDEEGHREIDGASISLRGLSASAPDYFESCGTLGLDPRNPVLATLNSTGSDPVPLKAWQVTAIMWMINQESSIVSGGVLADNCGLGKTLTTLSLIYLGSIKADQDADYHHQPTLLLCPRILIQTWIEEVSARFGDALRIILFYGSKDSTKNIHNRGMVLDTIDLLTEALQGLDPKNVMTSRTIVISSYATWARRTTRELEITDGTTGSSSKSVEDPKGKKDKAQSPEQSQDNLDEDADEEADEEAVDILSKMQDENTKRGSDIRRRKFESRMTGFFQRVVCDEGHCIKNISTRWHQSVLLLEAPSYWVISATPLLNRAVDICGPLNLFYKPSMADDSVSSDSKSPSDTDDFSLLTPKKLTQDANRGHLTAEQGYRLLPKIMKMIALQRSMGDLIKISDSVTIRIGSEIPPMRIMTLDMQLPKRLLEAHDCRYVALLAELEAKSANRGPKSEGDDAGHMDMGIIRLLSHLSFSPILDRFYLSAGAEESQAQMVHKYAQEEDRGFSILWKHTEHNPQHMIPTDRAAQAVYLAADCPKLRYLLKIFWDEGLFSHMTGQGKKPRFLIFCRWPLVMWLVELFLDALSLEYVTIRSSMNDEERAEAAREFGNPDSLCQVMLTTFQCGGFGLNLHHQCSNIIIMEPAPNLATMLQGLSRICRLGQMQKQKVFILFQAHSFSCWQEANNTAKALPQIAGDLSDIIKPLLEAEENEENHDDQERQALIHNIANEHLCRLLGQRSRLGHANMHDLSSETLVIKRKAEEDVGVEGSKTKLQKK